jgi:hypothetical protein
MERCRAASVRGAAAAMFFARRGVDDPSVHNPDVDLIGVGARVFCERRATCWADAEAPARDRSLRPAPERASPRLERGDP